MRRRRGAGAADGNLRGPGPGDGRRWAHYAAHGDRDSLNRRPGRRGRAGATGAGAAALKPIWAVSPLVRERTDQARGRFFAAGTGLDDAGGIRSLVLLALYLFDLVPDRGAAFRRGRSAHPPDRRSRGPDPDPSGRADVAGDAGGAAGGGDCRGCHGRHHGAGTGLRNRSDEGAGRPALDGGSVFSGRTMAAGAGGRRGGVRCGAGPGSFRRPARFRSISRDSPDTASRGAGRGGHGDNAGEPAGAAKDYAAGPGAGAARGISANGNGKVAGEMPAVRRQTRSGRVKITGMFWRIYKRLLWASRGRLAFAIVAVASGATVCAALVNLELDSSDN